MKLVELLAKELNEWPEGVVRAWQSGCDNEIYFDGANSEMFYTTQHADDSGYSGSRITRKQWKDEREKMNKPKWIRHRGGRMPVGEATIVDVRLRCGDIQKHEDCEFLWRHKDCDSAVNIMAYRVIEETKDQEIEEVKKTNFGTITYKLEIDATDANKEIDSLVAKWGQIESPLKWRDEIIELEAYEEEFRREREKLIRKLESEGFKLL